MPVATTSDWECRSAEISTLLQQDELDTMPGTPESITASFSGNTLTLTVTDVGGSISSAPTITYPTTGTAPFPAIIDVGGMLIPAPAGVAIINFDNDDITLEFEVNRAWAFRRIMDALEQTPAARIDTTRVAVSGCSRNGKGALVAGMIVLTIPQESGSGGTDSWRLSDWLLANGSDTQTASEIIQENVWLPFDHHLLVGMIAPRALLVIDNIGWGHTPSYSSYGAMVAARTIWTTMGSANCVFPSTQQAELTAFINKYLFGQSTLNTNFTDTAGDYDFVVPNAHWQWAPWTPASLIPSNGISTTTMS
ncbi:hypothetical protein K438DRAFT_1912428 [Mycena galopus ATCC 62051]|nr:hypothetical protein K438DRAFT_1912428 [Mycena galopus ATCC 62051]